MADMNNGRPDLEILIGVLGGGSISGASGKKIQHQLENIMARVNKLDFTKVKLKIDQKALQKQIETAIQNMPKQSIQIDCECAPGQGGGKGGGGGKKPDTRTAELAKIVKLEKEALRLRGQYFKVKSGTAEAREIKQQINEKQGESKRAKAKFAYDHKTSVPDVNKHVQAVDSVEKAQRQHKVSVAKTNDEYERQKKVLEDAKKEALEYKNVFQKTINDSKANRSQYTKDVKNGAAFKPGYQPGQMYSGAFVTELENNISGIDNFVAMVDAEIQKSFNPDEPRKFIDALNDVIKSYQGVKKGAEKAQKAINKHSDANTSLKKYSTNVRKFMQDIEATAPAEFYNQVKQFEQDLSMGSYNGNIKDAIKQFEEYRRAADKAGYTTLSLGQKIKKVFKEKFGYGVMAAAADMARRAIRQLYTNVVELDTAMTELKKVTNETAQAYERFLDNAASRANKLGASLSDVVSATADFARLGHSMEDAALLADVAIVYKNVGDGITDIGEASESVISTMQAFGIATEDAMTIVDRFNEVGNRFPISSSGIGTALLNSASALNAAGNDLNQSIALITAANSVIQDPSKVGENLRPAA